MRDAVGVPVELWLLSPLVHPAIECPVCAQGALMFGATSSPTSLAPSLC